MSATISSYQTSAKAYFHRAQARLSESSVESLFYAALELRCGVEARLKQYLEAQAHISKAKKRGWEIAKLGKGIEAAFRTGDQIVELSVVTGSDESSIARFLYTPVTSKLQKLGQQLGNYLHPTSTFSKRDGAWWLEFRRKLEEATLLLGVAISGELLGPPLLNTKTNEFQLSGEFGSDDWRIQFMQSLHKMESKFAVRVAYHKEWKLEITQNADAS